jgi:hypothetical protein
MRAARARGRTVLPLVPRARLLDDYAKRLELSPIHFFGHVRPIRADLLPDVAVGVDIIFEQRDLALGELERDAQLRLGVVRARRLSCERRFEQRDLVFGELEVVARPLGLC